MCNKINCVWFLDNFDISVGGGMHRSQILQENHQLILLGELNPYGTDGLVVFHLAIFFRTESQ